MNFFKQIQERVLRGTTRRRDVKFSVSAEELSYALGLPTDEFQVSLGSSDINNNIIRIHIAWTEADVG